MRHSIAWVWLVCSACGGGGGDAALDPCGPNGECPLGFECNPVDRLCYRSSASGHDAGSADAPASGPVTVLDDTPPLRTTGTSAVFEFSGGASYQCRLDGGAFAPCSPPFTVLVQEGVHTFEVFAQDAGGVADLTPESWSWEVDLTGPPVDLEGPAEGGTSGTSVTFGFTSETGATLACSLGTDTLAPCPTGAASYAGLAAGPHVFRVQATDDLGNAGPLLVRTWTVDATGPAVTIVPFANDVSDPDGTVTYSASDAGSTFACQLDFAAFSACPASGFSFTGLAPGKHVLTVHATDPNGNTGGDTLYSWLVMGTVVVRVEYRNMVMPGATVIGHTNSGGVVSTTATDAMGMATAKVVPDGMLSAAIGLNLPPAVINGTPVPRYILYTALDVQPGDNLVLSAPDPSRPIAGSVAVTSPVADSCCNRYFVDFGQSTTQADSTPPLFGAAYSFTPDSHDSTGRVNVLATAGVLPSGIAVKYAWVTGLDVPPGGQVSATLPPWSTAANLSATLRNIDGGRVQVQPGVHRNGVAYQVQDIYDNDNPDQTEAMTFHMPGTAFADGRWLKALQFAPPNVFAITTTQTVDIDMGTKLAALTAASINVAAPSRPRVSWTVTPPGLAGTDGGTIRLFWQSGGQHYWYVIMPPGLNVQFPALPASLADFRPPAGAVFSGAIQFAESTAVADYPAFKTMYPRIWEPDIALSIPRAPYILGPSFTTRLTQRTIAPQ